MSETIQTVLTGGLAMRVIYTSGAPATLVYELVEIDGAGNVTATLTVTASDAIAIALLTGRR